MSSSDISNISLYLAAGGGGGASRASKLSKSTSFDLYSAADFLRLRTIITTTIIMIMRATAMITKMYQLSLMLNELDDCALSSFGSDWLVGNGV
ncbi:hypothetical protein TVAG_025180 [Trichomonas vaginalis G3]|uniref:Uncharacterized protein n=1 Tax=Trichomonas vaginalis (strain ATCC PRA-98 / G3) TaxID=412133 RepID=A2FCV1_TRIV3|nr:hypothetical protein TVAGG3_0203400 [Trichomonas vaginalis G3]EAX97282.1 hypothetical protein TVAG_025180 [Trichomonas vaginalis G3]KAI5550754.1 hypothetical protein TVAGG3_0203400 [Trichomonas vaginalis G3]|eukprot:XP_001310212.1 hypothetical protein [Trichomonas vaginalis G3]